MSLSSTDRARRALADVALPDVHRVKDILSYLQLADNPSYTAALTRVINVPKRLIGDKTVRDILAAAKLKNMSTFAVCVKLAKGSSFVSLSSAQRKGIKEFVEVVKQLQAMAEEVRDCAGRSSS